MDLRLNLRYSLPFFRRRAGVGSALGIGGHYYRFDLPGIRAVSDASGLRSDWEAVGRDLGSCMAAHPAASPMRNAG